MDLLDSHPARLDDEMSRAAADSLFFFDSFFVANLIRDRDDQAAFAYRSTASRAGV